MADPETPARQMRRDGDSVVFIGAAVTGRARLEEMAPQRSTGFTNAKPEAAAITNGIAVPLQIRTAPETADSEQRAISAGSFSAPLGRTYIKEPGTRGETLRD